MKELQNGQFLNACEKKRIAATNSYRLKIFQTIKFVAAILGRLGIGMISKSAKKTGPL